MRGIEVKMSRIDTSLVQDNRHLALSVTTDDVTRCTRAIDQYGLLSLPVVGRFQDGTQALLSGECEFLALRAMGVHTVDAVEVPLKEAVEGNKLALLLSSLKKSPNALSEGLLLKGLLETGQCTQAEIATMIGKSSSWVNKRLSLVTRLSQAVQEMVITRRLCPHSAQEIARLPEDVQFKFAQKAVMEALPKSAVEKLVTAYNNEGYPDVVKQDILENPRHAWEKFEAKAVVPIRKSNSAKESPDLLTRIKNGLELLKRCINDTEISLAMLDKRSLSEIFPLLESVSSRIFLFYGYLEMKLGQKEFSPGKIHEKEGA